MDRAEVLLFICSMFCRFAADGFFHRVEFLVGELEEPDGLAVEIAAENGFCVRFGLDVGLHEFHETAVQFFDVENFGADDVVESLAESIG